MNELILGTIVQAYIIGAIMGVIQAWNKKVMFGIWILALIFASVRMFMVGSTEYVNGLNWGVWNWIVMLIFVFVGMVSGELTYKHTMGKK